MQAYLLFSISLYLAVGSLAERPHPCKSPPLVEGSMALTIIKEKTFGVEKFSYDAFEERVHLRLLLDQDNHTTYRDTLLLYKEGIAYQIFRHNQTCEKVHFKDPWKPMEIPRDAKFQSQVIIGSLSAPAEGLLVNNWSGTIAEPHDDYLLTFTEFGCLPVHAWWYNIEHQTLMSLSFFDMVLGVEDPEVFNPPSFCDKAEPGNDAALTSFFDALI
ncbi:ependymin [Salmo trutta]|uniref:Ependymin-like 2 n=1 Tax=Salmo trutta TaxID=8032 RepID=A0A674EQU8_SALTR|nr:ependymin-like [Salmo trutta]